MLLRCGWNLSFIPLLPLERREDGPQTDVQHIPLAAFLPHFLQPFVSVSGLAEALTMEATGPLCDFNVSFKSSAAAVSNETFFQQLLVLLHHKQQKWCQFMFYPI